MKLIKKYRKAFIIAIISCLVIFAAGVSYAYFSNMLHDDFNASIKMDLLFDKLSTQVSGEVNSPLQRYQEEKGYTYNANATWGTEQNPYVISNIRHMQNLSRLQSKGYFNNSFYTNTDSIPYFLVSTTEGTPTVIDGSGVSIFPIGTNSNPFIGSVCGAPFSGTVSVASTGYTADVSSIYNLKVISAEDEYDIGLFGYVSFTGEEPETTEEGVTFAGKSSVLSDFLLIDVKVETIRSLWDSLESWYAISPEHKFANHIGDTIETENGTINVHPETNHVGLLAGHVEYTTIKNISIYYTSEEICAINVDANDASETSVASKSNFYSATGLLGYLYYLNPVLAENEDGVSYIKANSGIMNDGISYTGSGGGGLLSGTKPGYVFAKDIYDLYGGDQSSDEKGTLLLYSAKNAANENLCTLVSMPRLNLWGYTISVNDYYYFYDGVFTFALSNAPTEDAIENVWPKDEGVMQIPQITCADNNDSAWEYTQLDSYSYMASLTPITELSQVNGKTVVLCYVGGDGKLHILNREASTTTTVPFTYTQNGLVYNINCGMDSSFFDNYKLNAVLSSGKYFFDSTSGASNGQFGVVATGLGTDNNVVFSKYFGTGTNSSFSTTRYTYQWGLTKSGNGFKFSMAAGYATKTSWFWYSFGTKTQNLTYNANDFVLTNSSGSAIMLCTVDINLVNIDTEDPTAPHGFAPINPTTATKVSADQYVLYADTEYHYGQGTGIPDANGDYYTTNSVNTNYGFDSSATAHSSLKYTLKSIESLGWIDSSGDVITNINQRFLLQEGIDIGMTTSFWGVTYYDKGVIKAPIGSEGVSTDMPTGTIAFKINRIPDSGEAKVNVIVAIDTSITGNASFGLWKVSTTSGFFKTTNFNLDNPAISFAIPTSNLATNSTDFSDYYQVNVDGVNKRTYLNGNIVLIAHTFTVSEIGVYVLGSTYGPMSICYFSSDGVASSGNDSTTGCQIGTIDYVYANASNKILTVNIRDTRDATASGYTQDNNSYYYPSYMFAFINNEAFPEADINSERFYIRRRLESGTRFIKVRLASDTVNEYASATYYSIYSDAHDETIDRTS